MNSRHKLNAPLPEGATVVRGHFDPLLAAHALRLADFPRPLAVIVAAVDSPLLPLEARRTMVAALRCVDCVLQHGHPHHDLTAEHDLARADFIRHVKARTNA